MTGHSETEAARATFGIGWVQVEESFSTHITFCTFHICLAEASPSPRVAHSWFSSISVAIAGNTLRKVVEPRGTPVALSPCDPGLAPALPTVLIAIWGGGPNDAPPGTVAAFTSSYWVEAEGMQLAGLTLGPDCAGRAEALPCCLFTKPPATVAWFAVWESIVACCTAGTLPPNDVGPAWALPALRIAVMADSPSRVTLTRQGAIMVKGHQGPGRILTESGGCLGINIKAVSSTIGGKLEGLVHRFFVEDLIVVILCRHH